MNGLNQVRGAVVQVLEDGGLTALAAYAGKAKRYDGPVITVDVAQAAGRAMALCSYLGKTYDEQAGTVKELYGRQLEVAISLEARAPAAEECENTMEAASELLVNRLPAGLRMGEQSWEAVSWDRDNQMFVRKGRFCCRAYFTAETDQEAGTLLDFILKGVMTT